VFILLTFIGCALGGVFRYLGTLLIARFFGDGFPWGTLVVNAAGSFLLGLLLGSGFVAKELWLYSNGPYAFTSLAFCGGLTTFSTFSLQTFSLISKQALVKAFANIQGSVLLCVFCVLSGYALGEGLTK